MHKDEIVQLPKELAESLKKNGVTSVTLQFYGGSDEGYLNIHFTGIACDDPVYRDLENAVDEWAWEVYEYSGAGDGSDYGDDITYDFEKGEIRFNEWGMVRHDEEEETIKLK